MQLVWLSQRLPVWLIAIPQELLGFAETRMVGGFLVFFRV